MKQNVTVDKFEGVVALINEKFGEISDTLDRIEKQTTKTNGSVGELQRWENTSKGAVSILSLVVLPLLMYLIYLHIPRG